MLKSHDKIDLDLEIGKDKVNIEDMVIIKEKKAKKSK